MANEENRILGALRLAIQMEIEGREYYLKVSEASRNEPGKKLLSSLANEEETHRRKCQEIYAAIRKEKTWPGVNFEPGKVPGFRGIFNEVASFKAAVSELDSIKIAIDMENKSYDFYHRQQGLAVSEDEKRFYQALAYEENGHKLALLDYYEYLQDPAAWFVLKEHPSLDRG